METGALVARKLAIDIKAMFHKQPDYFVVTLLGCQQQGSVRHIRALQVLLRELAGAEKKTNHLVEEDSGLGKSESKQAPMPPHMLTYMYSHPPERGRSGKPGPRECGLTHLAWCSWHPQIPEPPPGAGNIINLLYKPINIRHNLIYSTNHY